MSLKFLSTSQKRLVQGIISTSNTFYVNNILGWDGVTNITPADLGTVHYVCFRNDTGTVVEFMEIDPSTIGTGPITINKRGLQYDGNLTTESDDRKYDWATNTIVMFGTDVPQIFQWLKEYIDGIAIAGAPDATTLVKGLVKMNATAASSSALPFAVEATDVVSYKTANSGTDSYTINPFPDIIGYTIGQMFRFKADIANTGACTLAVSGLAAKAIKKDVSLDLVTGDILAGQMVVVIYDITTDCFQLISQESGVAKSADIVETYTVGALKNSIVKTYFNIQLPFTLWTGAVANDTTTTFVNWVRSGTDVNLGGGGAMAQFLNAGEDSIYVPNPFLFIAGTSSGDTLGFDDTNIVILDWWAKFNATGTGDITMGFADQLSAFVAVYNSSIVHRVAFTQRGSTGVLYATISKNGVGVTNTDISAGITVTNWNNYRIELDLANEAKFYINGVLKATLSGANLPNGTQPIEIGFARSDTASLAVTAPTLSLQMNP